MRFSAALVGLMIVLGAGCEDDEDFTVCSPLSAAELAELPQTLSQAGLFADMDTEALAEGVFAYKPRFTLWTDGATKRRWIFVPEGEQIDTSDMNEWRFPAGTKLFKEFTRDGVRVETRLMLKTGAGDDEWVASSYLWAQDQRDATLFSEGGDNQLGTPHDVPSAASCSGCHDGRTSRALGFSAVQLGYTPPEGFVTINDLKAATVLPEAVPELHELPANSVDAEALGYLHANCSHCHNTNRPASGGARCYDPQEDFDFSLPAAGVASVGDAPAYRSGVSEQVIQPGNAAQSELIQRFTAQRAQQRMPALGTEIIHAHGEDLLTRWINQLD